MHRFLHHDENHHNYFFTKLLHKDPFERHIFLFYFSHQNSDVKNLAGLLFYKFHLKPITDGKLI
jgi:hypothetical protein